MLAFIASPAPSLIWFMISSSVVDAPTFISTLLSPTERVRLSSLVMPVRVSERDLKPLLWYESTCASWLTLRRTVCSATPASTFAVTEPEPAAETVRFSIAVSFATSA